MCHNGDATVELAASYSPLFMNVEEVARDKLNLIVVSIDSKQTHMLLLTLCFRRLMCITSLIIMRCLLFLST